MSALTDLLALSDDKLRTEYERSAPDASKLRAKALKSIETTKNQFASATPTRGRKAFSVSNGIVRYQTAYEIGGKIEHYVPSERFNDFLGKLSTLIHNGDLDAALTADPAEGSTTKVRKPRKPREGGGSGWSYERRAKFAATVAARQANKG